MEDKFFHEQDRQLLLAIREKAATKQRKEALAIASGISNDDLLDQLDSLDVSHETVVALSLVPMIAVAWADGSMDVKERQAILDAAGQKGIESDHPGYGLLESWLKKKPDAGLLAAWKEYVGALSQTLSQPAMGALKEDVLGRARAVAETAGGLLGLGNKVSKLEQAVLSDLEQALG